MRSPSVFGVRRRVVSYSRADLPSGLGWLHEVKHDGYRVIARKDGDCVTLWSRYGTNFTDRLPRIAEAICSLAVKSALLDGEAITLRPDGHSDFAALRTKAGSARACLVAFDLLNLNGKDLRQQPIEERRAALSPLVAGVHGLMFSDAIVDQGALVFAHAAQWDSKGSSRSALAVVIRAETAGNG
jgi:bifunctional non-homologous end joining protein LigD